MGTKIIDGITWLSPKEAALAFETRPCPKTITRWMKLGVRPWRKGAPYIKLKSIRDGLYFRTSYDWIELFKRACADNVPGNGDKKPRSRKTRVVK